ncbi:MAG: DUF2868 domain-containing protein [Pirellulales bacterium]
MYPGKEIASQPLLADLLTIATLRGLEGDEPRFLPSVDLPLGKRLAPQDTSNPGAMAKVLAARADSILRAEYGLGRSAIAWAVKWLWRIRLLFVVFVAASAAGICGRVLLAREADQTVSVEGLVWFLAINIMMAVPPVLLMLAGLMKHPGHAEPEPSPRSFVAEILEDLGKALIAFYWVALAGMSLIQKHLLSRSFSSARSSEKVDRFGEAMGVLVDEQSDLLLKAVAMTSHLCWTIVCSVVLVCFSASTTFRDYDFQWHSTWLDQSGKLRWLENGAAPIRWLPPTPVPDKHLVAYLSAGAPQSGPEVPPIPLSTRIVDLARSAKESQQRVHSSSDRIRFPEDHGKGIEKQKQEGIAAAREHLYRLDSLVEAIRDDSNAMALLGSQGKETLNDLTRQLRGLRATAEERKTAAEVLLFDEAKNDREVKPQSTTGHINADQIALGTLLDGINREQQAARKDADLHSTSRASCAHLMASFLLYYGVVPRLILLVIARIQLARSLRALRPSLTSPYIAQIIVNLTKPPMGPSSDPALPTGTSRDAMPFTPPATAVGIASRLKHTSEPAPLHPAKLASAPPALSANELPLSPPCRPGEAAPAAMPTDAGDQLLDEPASPQPPPKLSAIVGYEVEAPAGGWRDAIPLSTLGEVAALGNAADRKSRGRAVSELSRLASEVRFLTIVVDVIGSPDSQFVTFLRAAIASLPSDAALRTVVLLSGGDGLRVKFSDDAERIRVRVRLWREKSAECGVQENHVFEFDHRVATPESRRQLLDRLESIRGAMPGEELHSPTTVVVAGKFGHASKLIRAAARAAASYSETDQFAHQTRELHKKIRDLYDQEATWLSRTCLAFGHPSDSLPPLAAPDGDQASHAFDKLQNGAASLIDVGCEKLQRARQWWSSFSGYARGLSGHWAVAGGLAAALGGSLAGVPAIATVWLLAAGAALGAQLPALKQKLVCLLPPASDKQMEAADAGDTPTGFSLDDLVRTNVVWALVLELQGNSEETIATTLRCLLNDCCPGLIGTANETHELLDQLHQRLRHLPAIEPVK